MAHTMHVVSHTHWDREWYLTFQQFRMRLIDLVDHVLDLLDRDPDYRYFSLDAQTIVLEDYLAIKPQNRPRLERYIREGRITVGPWYQLNDEFLTSGEATVRSLLAGTRLAQQFGACMKIGYLPDQFGNLSQMPQIYRGFGIDNVILGRGYQLIGDRKMEFLWESPDGSQVIASLMAFWYNNAQHFPSDPEAALKYTQGIRDRMAPRSAVSHLLLMNGVDHLEAQQDLAPILRAVNERLPEGTRLVHATLPQYIEAVKAEVAQRGLTLEKRVGELREDRGGACLAGTLSSRMYLKQANHHAQITLEKYAEPFSAFAMQIGNVYHYEMLHYAWKLLMQNHPHDSICGCSIDQVHREMMPRFAQVEQIGEELIERALRYITDRIDVAPSATVPEPAEGKTPETESATALVVFNTLNWTRTDPVTITLAFPLGPPTRGNPPRDDRKQIKGFLLLDEAGAEIPFAVTANTVKMIQVLSPVELPFDQWVQEVAIEFVAADVPACGYKTYTLRPAPAFRDYGTVPYEGEPEIRFEDVGDVGDEYLHRKPLRDTALDTACYDREWTQQNAVRTTSASSCDWRLPAAATPDGQARAEETVSCALTLHRTRWRDVPRVELKVTFDNRARDHRLRLFVQGCVGDYIWANFSENPPLSYSEGQFDVVERPTVQSNEQRADGASPFYPQQSWTAIRTTVNRNSMWPGPDFEKDAYTIAVANRGLPEFEVVSNRYGEAHRAIAVTLLRCVGYLSRRGDGPQIETPEAQCLGEHTFELACYGGAGDWKEAQVWKQAHQFNTPLRAVQTVARTVDTRALPSSHSFVSVQPDALIVTAIKRAEDDPNRLIVRFFNTTDEPVTDAQVALAGAKSAQRVNLNEEAQESLGLDASGALTLPTVGPKQIVTFAFEIQKPHFLHSRP